MFEKILKTHTMKNVDVKMEQMFHIESKNQNLYFGYSLSRNAQSRSVVRRAFIVHSLTEGLPETLLELDLNLANEIPVFNQVAYC